MPITLTERQSAKVAAALRRGAIDALRIADAIDPFNRTHFLIEVSDMGQFAKDWEHLKTLIRQKDDAIDRQSTQIAALQKQVSAQPALDAEDQKAVAEVHQTANANPVAPAAKGAAAKPAAAPAHPQTPGVTTFSKP